MIYREEVMEKYVYWLWLNLWQGVECKILWKMNYQATLSIWTKMYRSWLGCFAKCFTAWQWRMLGQMSQLSSYCQDRSRRQTVPLHLEIFWAFTVFSNEFILMRNTIRLQYTLGGIWGFLCFKVWFIDCLIEFVKNITPPLWLSFNLWRNRSWQDRWNYANISSFSL